MEEEKDDRFFQNMSEELLDNTVREFGELMVSSLTENRTIFIRRN